MNNLPCFYDDLSPAKTKEILLLEAVPFSFLIRRVGRENVVSFLDARSSVQHQILPVRHDSSLFRHQPQLQHQGPLEVFNFLRSISTEWLHPVTMTDDMRNHIDDSSWISDICRICGVVNPTKNHADSHSIVYCHLCNGIVAKNSRGIHKCHPTSTFHCPSCTYSASTKHKLSKHIDARHSSKKFKCDATNCHMSFMTQKRLCEHKGNVHGMGFSCEECGKNFKSKSSRNRHVSVLHRHNNSINNNRGPSSDANGSDKNKKQEKNKKRKEDKKRNEEDKKREEEEDIIKLLVEKELGLSLTIKSYIENLILDEAWSKIQNKSPQPQQQQQFNPTSPSQQQPQPQQQQQQPPSPQDHISCRHPPDPIPQHPDPPPPPPQQQQPQVRQPPTESLGVFVHHRQEPQVHPCQPRPQQQLPHQHHHEQDDRAQEARAGEQGDPDRAEDQL